LNEWPVTDISPTYDKLTNGKPVYHLIQLVHLLPYKANIDVRDMTLKLWLMAYAVEHLYA